MSYEKEQMRARELQTIAIGRNLTDSEVAEASGLVRDLMENDLPHAAAWAYDAIRRTYKRKQKARTDDHLRIRSLERTALARLVKGGLAINPSGAPDELTIGKTVSKEKGFDSRVRKLEKNILKDVDRLRGEVVQEPEKK